MASRIVARVDPRVKGMAADGAGELAMGERPRLAGAGAVPGAPMPVDEGVAVMVTLRCSDQNRTRMAWAKACPCQR